MRGPDTGHVSCACWKHAVRKEIAAAAIIATVAGTALGLIAAIWSRSLLFGVVVGAAMACSAIAAAAMGSVIPMASKHLGFDPATTAGPKSVRASQLVWNRGLAVALVTVHYPDVTPDPLLTAVFGGLFIGAGIGLAIRGGAVLDGTEMAALLFVIALAVLGVERALYLNSDVRRGS